jgi:hypothetical protein
MEKTEGSIPAGPSNKIYRPFPYAHKNWPNPGSRQPSDRM